LGLASSVSANRDEAACGSSRPSSMGRRDAAPRSEPEVGAPMRRADCLGRDSAIPANSGEASLRHHGARGPLGGDAVADPGSTRLQVATPTYSATPLAAPSSPSQESNASMSSGQPGTGSDWGSSPGVGRVVSRRRSDASGADMGETRRPRLRRFNSITEEMEAIKLGEAEEAAPPQEEERIQCATCGRRFVVSRIERHNEICSKARLNEERRGKFDARKHRAVN